MDPENGSEIAPNYEDMEEITIGDDHTISFRLSAPNYAFLDYGDCYYLGIGVEQDLKTAGQWYQKALEGYEPDETDQEHLREVMGTESEAAQADTDFGKTS